MTDLSPYLQSLVRRNEMLASIEASLNPIAGRCYTANADPFQLIFMLTSVLKETVAYLKEAT